MYASPKFAESPRCEKRGGSHVNPQEDVIASFLASVKEKGENKMNEVIRNRIRRAVLLVLVPTTFLLFPFSLRADSREKKPTEATSSKTLPNAVSVIRQMKEMLEPEGPSLRRIDLTVKNPTAYTKGDETVEKVAGLAVKNFPDGKRMLLVMLEPDDVKGMAFLIQERKDQADVMWTYVPAIRRVREIKRIDQYENLLGTDFTYADLGFIKLHGHYKLLGEEEHNGVRSYKIQEKVPQDLLYYSKIITWVAADSMLPIERDFYDPAGGLMKREVFQDATLVDGVPTALRMVMKDVEQHTSTELNTREVDYDTPLPDKLFDPHELPVVSSHGIWKLCMDMPGKGK
jgi:hypothetical protein